VLEKTLAKLFWSKKVIAEDPLFYLNHVLSVEEQITGVKT